MTNDNNQLQCKEAQKPASEAKKVPMPDFVARSRWAQGGGR